MLIPLLRLQVTLRGVRARPVQAVPRTSPVYLQACYTARRALVRSAAVQLSEAASSEQASASSSSAIDWEAFDAHLRDIPKLSDAEEAMLLLDSGR